MKLLKQADFSGETDLKERLRRKLFAAQITPIQSRQVLEDDDAALINAAGDPSFLIDRKDPNEKGGPLRPAGKN